MLKTVTIGDKNVKLNANAATPIVYREMTGRDLFKDLAPWLSGKEALGYDVLSTMAYIMARDAGEDVPDTISEWLAGFDGMLDVYNALPDIMGMWMNSTKTVVKAKKKSAEQNGKTVQL